MSFSTQNSMRVSVNAFYKNLVNQVQIRTKSFFFRKIEKDYSITRNVSG